MRFFDENTYIPCQKDENVEFWQGTRQPSRCRKTPRTGSIQANSNMNVYTFVGNYSF